MMLKSFYSSVLKSTLLILLACMSVACVTVTKGGFSDKASPDKAAENFTKLGLAYLQQGNVNRARDRLRKALEIRPEYAPAHDAMGLLWQREGEFDYSQESFSKAIEYDPKFNLARHHFGLLMLQQKKYAQADRLFLTASDDRFYENRAQVFKDLAISSYQQKKPKKAVQYYRTALRLIPYDATALVNVSTLLFELKQYKDSNKYFKRLQQMVRKKSTKNTAHSLWLGIRLSVILNQSSRARILASELKKRFPTSSEYRAYKTSLKRKRS